ncbi:hypothetical protein BFW38_01920 [Terasakiispira papahanaumokuakeensis]|uniref:Uncharacterized protein n=1 Tax=Terasakiispira papahanaumokuakeensis TaxID=197479 RepID=A0A1E2V752_9GAMM|nr:hypothetical protein BFW38_01920 [Terasakiispira papahanaumokuakeensis]
MIQHNSVTHVGKSDSMIQQIETSSSNEKNPTKKRANRKRKTQTRREKKNLIDRMSPKFRPTQSKRRSIGSPKGRAL